MRAPGPGRPNRRFPGDLKNWVRSIRPGTRWCERGAARRCFFPSDGLRGRWSQLMAQHIADAVRRERPPALIEISAASSREISR